MIPSNIEKRNKDTELNEDLASLENKVANLENNTKTEIVLDETDKTYGIKISVFKNGKTITLRLSCTSILKEITSGQINYTLFTLPGGCRPPLSFTQYIPINNTSTGFSLVVNTNGAVQIGFAYSSLSKTTQIGQAVTFVAS